MKFDAPLLFLRDILSDCARQPAVLKDAFASYANARSFSHPVGCVPAISIFDVVTNAEAIPVVMQGIFEIPLFPRQDIVGNSFETASTSLRDSYYLALLVKHSGARNILEVGTSFGETALLLAMNSGKDATVRTLDIQLDNPTVGSRFRETSFASKIREHRCSLADLKSQLDSGTFDFIFIDGDHSYEGVLRDSRVAHWLLRPGGMIAWHDYSFRFRRDVVPALDLLRRDERWDISKLLYSNLSIYVKPDGDVA